MTTFTDFVPNNVGPFSFQPTLDGQVYTLTVTWNVFGQRWYVTLRDLQGNRIFTLPLIGSQVGIPIDSLEWDQLEQVVVVTTQGPHGFAVNETVDLTIVGCVPDDFNGTVRSLVTGKMTFTYPEAADPGIATAFGAVQRNVSLTAGYFASTLIFREANQQFEVSP